MRAITIILCSTLAASPAFGAAGKLLFVAGPVTIERATPVAAKAGDAVEQGDILATGDKARAQLLMNDGARIALRSGTRYRIDEFALPSAVTSPVKATTANASGKAVASLLKGGFRTTSGAIGKADPSAYAVRTPVGTLGIRGTRYAAVWCAGDCRDAAGLAPGAVVTDGLYLGVEEGVVVLQNGAGEFRIPAGQVLLFPAAGGEPVVLDRQPPWLEQDSAGVFELAGGGGTGKASDASLPGVNERRSPAAVPAGEDVSGKPSGTDPGVDQQIIGTLDGQTIDLTPGGPRPQSNVPRDLGWSLGDVPNGARGWSDVEVQAPAGYALDANGNLVGFNGIFPAGEQMPATFDLGTATVTGTGSSAVAVLRWGRWSGGELGVDVAGTPSTVSLAQQSLHWILSGDTTNPPVLPIAGVVTYTLAGGTAPTDIAGNVGTLGSATLAADFTNSTLTAGVNLTIDGNNWVASGVGAIGAQADLPAHQFSGVFEAVQINPIQGSGSGEFSGFFSGPASGPAGSPAGAGLAYSLRDSLGVTQLNGTAALVAP